MNQYPQRHRSPSAGLSLALAGAAFVMTGYLVWDRLQPGEIHGDAAPRAVIPRGELGDWEKERIRIYRDNGPSVVHITSPEVRYRDGYNVYRIPAGTGTGFVWDARGYVVTNFHVIAGRQRVQVRMFDQEKHNAVVVGTRQESDIAVLKLVNPPQDLRPMPIGSSADLQVGQSVLAIGNPFGLDQTLTAGVISALDRTIETEASRSIKGVVQVDAAINPGNSGGPLLDSAGRLIGMNTAIKSPTGTSAGIGFAVPVDLINEVVPSLIRGDAVEDDPDRAILGILPEPRTWNIGNRQLRGIVVAEVYRGSGAEAAGLVSDISDQHARGDMILEVGGERVATPSDLAAVLNKRRAGETVRIKLLRGYPYDPNLVEVDLRLSRIGDIRR